RGLLVRGTEHAAAFHRAHDDAGLTVPGHRPIQGRHHLIGRPRRRRARGILSGLRRGFRRLLRGLGRLLCGLRRRRLLVGAPGRRRENTEHRAEREKRDEQAAPPDTYRHHQGELTTSVWCRATEREGGDG